MKMDIENKDLDYQAYLERLSALPCSRRITRKTIDGCRQALKVAKPYSESDLCVYDGEEDKALRKTTYAKIILEHLGLSVTDPDDYGDIRE